ncbi:MAG: uroporphyrinogen decarboxylase family protein [Christensenellaceae bacterium]|nr:uroporphyrinogen decarboxylase family protein [Christensenellaceae bacterium]
MKRNMKEWVAEVIAAQVKKPMPLLSFPCISLMDITVSELIADSEAQARGLKAVADRVSAGAAVSLMDLSVEAECFGSEIRLSGDEVPTVVGAVITDMDEAQAMEVPEVGSCRTGIYIDAIAKAAQMITDRPVFAGVIGPYSLAGRLLDVSEAMMLCYDDPDMVHEVLGKCTQFIINYCRAYKEAGANGVAIAEPLAGLISPALAAEFSHPYIKQIVDAVQDDSFAVIYHNCGNYVAMMTEELFKVGAMGYHFGDMISMTEVLPKAPADVLIMGNVSPANQFKNGTPESMREETQRIMRDCCGYPNFVISSGCDIPPLSPWENTDAFFAAAADFYKNI